MNREKNYLLSLGLPASVATFVALSVVLATFASAAHAQTNLISDPGFESPAIPAQDDFLLSPSGTAWNFSAGDSGITANSPSGYQVNGGAAEGTQYAYLGAGNPSSAASTISQTFTVASLSNLAISFAVAGRSVRGDTDFSASLDGDTIFTETTTTNSTFSQVPTINLSGISAGSHTLTFSDSGFIFNAETAVLDNVSVYATATGAATAPEPGALALVISLTVPSVLVARRRRPTL